MNSLERFDVTEVYWGTDSVGLESRSHSYAALPEAISEAEGSWKNGKSERISVVDCSPLETKEMPRILWLRQRAEKLNWQILFGESDLQLLGPELPGILDFTYSYKVPARRARVIGVPFLSTSDLLPIVLENPEPLQLDHRTLLEVIERIWRHTWTAYKLLGIPMRIHFDGISVEKDCIAMYLREEQSIP